MLRLVHNVSVDKRVNKTGNGYMSSGMQFHRGDNESRRGCFNVQFIETVALKKRRETQLKMSNPH